MSIGADNVFGLMAAFLSLAALAALLENTAIGRRLSGVVLVMLGALAASHFGVIPRSAPFYGAIWTYLVPLAIALFLLKADLVKVFSEGGRVLLGFFAGMVGATVGAILGAAFLDLGANEQKLAAVYSATYTGGSLNFVAVAEAVNFTDASDLAAALAIDNILGVGFIVVVNLAAGWTLFQRRFHWRAQSAFAEAPENAGESAPPSVAGLLTALACAAVVVALSESVAAALGLERYALLFLTVLMTAAATIGRRFLGRLNGEELIAMILMYLFFAVIGAGADIDGMLASAPPLFIFVLTIFIVHLVFLLAAGALLKLNHAELVVASLACITGPPVAAAIAIMMNWRNLVAPGILTGILGYVLGNFIGIGVFTLLGGNLQ
ncbi:MAG: DUF819 family protein [Amphiplicatus sp.]